MLSITRGRLLKLSLCQLIASVAVFIINFFFYHFVTDDGITLTFQEEAGKPFVAMLIGFFATLLLFSAVFCLAAAFILCDKENKNKKEDIE